MRQERTVACVLTMVAGLLLTGGCASTEITDTWVDPAARGAGLSRVAVICLAKDEGLRRMAEDEVAKQSKTTRLIPSYQLLDGIDLHDREAVKGRLRSAGVDGALLMRMAGVSEKLVAAGPYDRFDPYYDWAYSGAYAPRTETTVRMVSNLYSLKEDKLIWTGASNTFDPTSARQVVNEVSHQVAKALQKDRLIL
jgi:hypothetical protein